MAAKHKVSVSTDPQTYRLSANERRAARAAEIANTQAQLKREAAERRAKRAKEHDPPGQAAGASRPGKEDGTRRSNSR